MMHGLWRSCLGALVFAGMTQLGFAQFPVVTYHAHENLGYTLEQFEWHLDFYKDNGYNTIGINDFWAWYKNGTALPPRPMLLTVDDNYIKLYTEMYGAMKERGMRGINFVITSVTEGGSWPSCNWAQLTEMENAGTFEALSHSQTHPYLAELTQTEQRTQLRESRSVLESHIGKSIKFLAYPYGSYSALTISETSLAGYDGAFAYDTSLSGEEASVYRDTPPYELPRMACDWCTNVTDLKAKVGFIAPLPVSVTGKGWTCDDREVAAVYDSTAWTEVISSAQSAIYGKSFRMRSTADGTKPFLWKTLLPLAGRYRVYAKWYPQPKNATNATYIVKEGSTVSAECVVNQRENAGVWNPLGYVYVATPMQNVSVTLADSGNGALCADAVWFEWLGASPDSAVNDWSLF
ncbi:polysaccharide deacetylase family protein [Candidatus Sumerlaeota bacterium]|nr:polysaccharide deacetylase family protein [Candidatus Sumerlaeota bacterium]